MAIVCKMVDNPTLYMMIGVPAAGKSTWRAAQNFDPSTTVVVSTDDYLDSWAELRGTTYNSVFQGSIQHAEAAMMADLRAAVDEGKNLVWDQTNLNVKTRAKKLRLIPNHYRKVAVFFATPDPTELERRLASRPGKTIPPHVVRSMTSTLEVPAPAEGFDEVIVVK